MYTKGPWKVNGRGANIVCDEYGNRIVSTARDLSCDVWGSDSKDNARLISAAPEMLEALELFLIVAEKLHNAGFKAEIKEAQRVIKKAKGEQK